MSGEPTVTVDALRNIAKPLVAEGATEIYFTAFRNRVYVGRVPAERFQGAEGKPTNYCLTAEEISDDKALLQVCEKLTVLIS
jgi:hypothetical protein